MELSDQVVVVSGGASGLGAATVRRFAAAGSHVAVLDLNNEAGDALAAEIGGLFLACDVSDVDAVETAFDHSNEVLGPVRVAVCCAGIGPGSKMVGRNGPHRLDTFEKNIAVNLFGTFNVLRAAAWRMHELDALGADGERGVLITTSSIAAFDGVDGGVAYSASKAGVAGMTLPLARDLAPHGIRAVSIAPGSFDTPLVEGMPDEFRDRLDGDSPFPGRFGMPDEFAMLAQHVVENPMLNGTVIRLDAGLRMRPSEGWK